MFELAFFTTKFDFKEFRADCLFEVRFFNPNFDFKGFKADSLFEVAFFNPNGVKADCLFEVAYLNSKLDFMGFRAFMLFELAYFNYSLPNRTDRNCSFGVDYFHTKCDNFNCSRNDKQGHLEEES